MIIIMILYIYDYIYIWLYIYIMISTVSYFCGPTLQVSSWWDGLGYPQSSGTGQRYCCRGLRLSDFLRFFLMFFTVKLGESQVEKWWLEYFGFCFDIYIHLHPHTTPQGLFWVLEALKIQPGPGLPEAELLAVWVALDTPIFMRSWGYTLG